MSNSDSLSDHFIIRPAMTGRPRIFLMGWSVTL